MRSYATGKFWVYYYRLPTEVQKLALKNWALVNNPRPPSIHFKKVGRFWSARVGEDYRALGVMEDDAVIWFWIGPHHQYERIISG